MANRKVQPKQASESAVKIVPCLYIFCLLLGNESDGENTEKGSRFFFFFQQQVKPSASGIGKSLILLSLLFVSFPFVMSVWCSQLQSFVCGVFLLGYLECNFDWTVLFLKLMREKTQGISLILNQSAIQILCLVGYFYRIVGQKNLSYSSIGGTSECFAHLLLFAVSFSLLGNYYYSSCQDFAKTAF